MQLQHRISESIVSFGHNTYGTVVEESGHSSGHHILYFLGYLSDRYLRLDGEWLR